MMEYPMGFGKAGIQMVRNNWNNRWRMENYTALRLGGIQMWSEKDESLYQNGRVISIVVWKPNGEKCSDTKLINGNGVWVRYKENGTESWRSNYRNGQYLLN